MRLVVGPHRRRAGAGTVEATFTPDSRYLLCGTGEKVFLGRIDRLVAHSSLLYSRPLDDGTIHVYDVSDGKQVCTWQSVTKGVVAALRFNPRLMIAASADSSISLWTPPPADA